MPAKYKNMRHHGQFQRALLLQHLSLGGHIDHIGLCADIPADRLLIETDAPYLLPRDMQPKPASRRNEPAYLPHILTRIAGWRGEESQWLENVTDANVRRLFGVCF